MIELWSNLQLCLTLFDAHYELAAGVENYTLHNPTGNKIGCFDNQSQTVIESSSVVDGFEIRNHQGEILIGTLYPIVKTIPHIVA